ncbi:hypothetical protein HK405_012165, partial [Cladochytrium tenue]
MFPGNLAARPFGANQPSDSEVFEGEGIVDQRRSVVVVVAGAGAIFDGAQAEEVPQEQAAAPKSLQVVRVE